MIHRLNDVNRVGIGKFAESLSLFLSIRGSYTRVREKDYCVLRNEDWRLVGVSPKSTSGLISAPPYRRSAYTVGFLMALLRTSFPSCIDFPCGDLPPFLFSFPPLLSPSFRHSLQHNRAPSLSPGPHPEPHVQVNNTVKWAAV